MKKQGKICVCVNYWDVNCAYPKDNYLTLFINHIVDDCVGSQIYSFMDGFSGYDQINILPADQPKTAFISPWGTFSYQKLPFGLKTVGAMLQWEMDYAFHDIKHIMQPYLDDLPAHSKYWFDHSMHLSAILLLWRHYNIRLNPHKCLFCVSSGRFLSF